jgi:hypothetical protein
MHARHHIPYTIKNKNSSVDGEEARRQPKPSDKIVSVYSQDTESNGGGRPRTLIPFTEKKLLKIM